MDDNDHSSCSTFNPRRELWVIAVSLTLLILGIIFRKELESTPYSWAEYAVFLVAYLLAGWKVLLTAARNLIKQPFDENFLMSIATIGAIVIHELPEAVAVLLFFRVGEFLQDLAVSNSRRSIKSLLELRPETANLKDGRQVPPEEVEVGELILIRPGERVPLDGEVVEGRSQMDTSALTGESVPRRVNVGEMVLGGMINKEGLLTVRVTKLFAESSIAKILELVENASTKKAKTEKFITKLARYYTPIVVIGALALATLPPLFFANQSLAEWVGRALVLLVISCPCGLVISIPLGYFGGVGGAAKRGILIKGATFLDTLTKPKVVAFDKTGTLTKGSFRVTEVETHNGFSEDELLSFAAQAESHSTHPIALSIVEASPEKPDPSKITEYEELPAQGIRAVADSREILVGNDRLLHNQNIEHPICDVDGTVAHIVIDRKYAGYLVISDEIKEDSARAVQELRDLGVKSIMMLTGDSKAVAKRVSAELKLDSYKAELLPEEKLEVIEGELKHGTVIFVGDGINDAPVLTRADIGIAMGALGSDAAIETADVVIMTDAPSKVPEAIRGARKTRRIVIQNITFALGVKSVFIVLGAMGLATIWQAVFADVGVALIAILNSTRTLRK